MLATIPRISDILTVKLKVFLSSFEGKPEVTFVPVWGSTLDDILPDYVKSEPAWIVVKDGAVYERATWSTEPANPGSEVTCYRRLGKTPLAKAIAGFAFWPLGAYYIVEAIADAAGVNTTVYGVDVLGLVGSPAGGLAAIGGRALSALSPQAPTIPSFGAIGNDSQSSPTYGFGGIQNDMRAGAVIPVVYGQHRIGGPYLELFIRTGVMRQNTAPAGTVTINFTQGSIFLAGLTVDQNAVVNGSGTAFTTDVKVGQVMLITNIAFRVTSIESDVLLHAMPTGDVIAQSIISVPYTVIQDTGSGDDDLLSGLVALSEGPIDSVSAIELNGQPIENYRNVKLETSSGLNVQVPPNLFGGATIDTIASDALLIDAFSVYSTARNNITAFEFNLIAPNGLFTATDSGAMAPVRIDIEWGYRLQGTVSYTSLPTFTIMATQRTAVRRVARADNLPPGAYDFRIRRTLPESSGSLKISDSLRRSSVNEIINDGYCYPNVAWGAYQVQASDQLSGGRPTVTWLVKGRLVRVYTSLTTFTITWSDNPAWCVLDFLTNRRFGGGNHFAKLITRDGTLILVNGWDIVIGAGTNWLTTVKPGMKLQVDAQGFVGTVLSVELNTQITLTADYAGATAGTLAYEILRDDIDVQSFLDWAAFCDADIDDGKGGLEKYATLNMVLDSSTTALWDVAQKMAGSALGALVKTGNYVYVKFQAIQTPQQLFCMANIMPGTFREKFLPLREQVNYVEVQFKNAEKNFADDVRSWEDPLLFTNEEPEKKQTISLPGIVRASQAARLAAFTVKLNRFTTRYVEWKCGVDAVQVQPGDVVNFQHDIPQWGFSSRVAPGSGASTVILDHPQLVESGKTYQLLVRHADDSMEIRTVTNTPGTYTALTISVPWAIIPSDSDTIAFGETGILVKPFRILGITRTSDFHVQISALEYADAVYDGVDPKIYTPIQYSVLQSPTAPPAQVTNLLVSQISGGTQISVEFRPPTDLRFQTGYIFRELNGQFQKLGESRTGTQTVLGGFQYGDVVTIRVASVSKLGAVANLLESPSVTVVIRSNALPPQVTGLELAGQAHDTNFIGKDAKFTWRDRSNLTGIGNELLGYELLGVGNGGSDVFFRDYRVELYDGAGVVLRRREYVVDPSYIYSFEKNYEDGVALGSGPVRSFMIRVWQRDMFNQLSELPAELVVANLPPPLLNNLGVFPTFQGYIVQYLGSTDIDVDGYSIWADTVSGFTPSDANRIYHGKDTFVNVKAVPGTTYYIRAAAFDTFDESGLNLSGELQITPSFLDPIVDLPNGSITEVKIEDGAISTPKLRANAVTADKVTTGQLLTLSAQIADAVITNAHIVSMSADKIDAASITSDKFILPLWGDLSQAIAYVSDILSRNPEFDYTFINADIDNVACIKTRCYRDHGFGTPVISIEMTRRWGDGLPWWGQVGPKWGEPVTTLQASCLPQPLSLGSDRTGRAEVLFEKILENPATATVRVWMSYYAAGGGTYGLNYPLYNDTLFEELTDLGLSGGTKTRYRGTVRAGVRYLLLRIDMQTSVATDRISIADPELSFNDTRLAADQLSLVSTTSATGGAASALPATPAGYFTFQRDNGAVVKVPYYNP